MDQIKHESVSGNCAKCNEILSVLGGVDKNLRGWFKLFQNDHKEAHVSCGNRGAAQQEELFKRGASKAHWGESAHGYGYAIDIWEDSGVKSDIYERIWFERVLKPALTQYGDIQLEWFGVPGSKFWELPHIQLASFRQMLKAGKLKLVE